MTGKRLETKKWIKMFIQSFASLMSLGDWLLQPQRFRIGALKAKTQPSRQRFREISDFDPILKSDWQFFMFTNFTFYNRLISHTVADTTQTFGRQSKQWRIFFSDCKRIGNFIRQCHACAQCWTGNHRHSKWRFCKNSMKYLLLFTDQALRKDFILEGGIKLNWLHITSCIFQNGEFRMKVYFNFVLRLSSGFLLQ